MKSLLLSTVASLGLATAASADITVYSAGPGGLANRLAAGFTDATGVGVNLYQATTGKVMARLEAEAANPQADVVVSASWGTATDMDAQGLLLAYTSPNAAKVPDFLKTETAVAEGVAALAIGWNPTSGTPKPTDWADLAKPEYKDLVTMPDPAQSGSAFELVAAIEGSLGNGLFDDLAANGALVAGANAQALNPVLQGAKAAIIGGVDYKLYGANAKGESIEVVLPTSGTVVAPRPAMILKSSQHQDEAKKFIDYILSDEGQEMVASTFLMPSRADVGAKRPTIAELKLLPTDSAAANAERDTILTAFAATFAQ
jgi:iron(III) transport system substrate-binding protein